jgi:hypothetical protein
MFEWYPKERLASAYADQILQNLLELSLWAMPAVNRFEQRPELTAVRAAWVPPNIYSVLLSVGSAMCCAIEHGIQTCACVDQRYQTMTPRPKEPGDFGGKPATSTSLNNTALHVIRGALGAHIYSQWPPFQIWRPVFVSW